MSVQSEITRITGNIADAYTAVSGKGGTLPTARNSANLPAAIDSIPIIHLENAEDVEFGTPPPVAPDWSTGSFEEIKIALDAYHSRKQVDFSAWNIGDQRAITIDGSSYNLVLAHKFEGTPVDANAPYAFNGTAQYPAYAVVCIPQNGGSPYMLGNQVQKYFNGELHTYCNSTQYNKIKSTDVGQCFKPFQCYVGKENTGSSAITGTYNQQVYLASLAMKEVGLSNTYNTTEDDALITFSYFDSESKRAISGNIYYWLRSPHYGFEDNYRSWIVNSPDGSPIGIGVYNTTGVVWFGCI